MSLLNCLSASTPRPRTGGVVRRGLRALGHSPRGPGARRYDRLRQLQLLDTDDPDASDGLRDERDELLANLRRALESDEERDRTRAALQEGFDRKEWMTGRAGLRFERTTPQE